jgi:hypothetical protein
LSLPTCDLKLFALNRQEAAVADLEAAPFVRAVNGLASDCIDELLAEPIAGAPIDLTEGDALGCRCRRIDGFEQETRDPSSSCGSSSEGEPESLSDGRKRKSASPG